MSDRYSDECRERDEFIKWMRVVSPGFDESGGMDPYSRQWRFANESVDHDWQIWAVASKVRA